MSDLPPRREREENLKWIKWSVILSGFAVIGSIFSGWMAYNASLSSAEISGKMNKENEIESRLYQQKYEIYKGFTTEIHKLINFPGQGMDKENIDRYKRNIQNLEDFILEKGPGIRILGGDNVNMYFNCLSNNIDGFKNETLGQINKIDSINNEIFWRSFQEEVILSLWFLENSMRKELGREDLSDIYYASGGTMKNIYNNFNDRCRYSGDHIQSSNYFSGYLYNLK